MTPRKAPTAAPALVDAPATADTRSQQVRNAIPVPVEIAGQWAWRLLAIAGVLFVFGLVFYQVREIAIPFMVAILVSALLVPLKNFMVRHRWPRGIAIAVTLLGALGIVAGLIYLVQWQIRLGLPDLREATAEAYEEFKAFLADSSLGINAKEFDAYVQGAIDSFSGDGGLWSGALSVGSTVGHIITGALLAIFATLFILIDGKQIWAWITRLFPRRARKAVGDSGAAGWLTLTTFVKVQVFVAAVDAFGIGLGAWIIGLFFGGFPLVIPIAIAVFLGSFIPIVGAVVTGILAVFVALVYLGPLPAALMLGVVLLVQQVEGHVLQPLVVGSAVKVHPLAVVFAVAAGAGIAGIPGALFAVPIVAVINVMVNYIASGKWRTQERPDEEDVVSPA